MRSTQSMAAPASCAVPMRGWRTLPSTGSTSRYSRGARRWFRRSSSLQKCRRAASVEKSANGRRSGFLSL
jgi:hypothetical protein